MALAAESRSCVGPQASAQSLLVATFNSVLTVCDVIQMRVVPRSAGVVYEGAIWRCIDFILLLYWHYPSTHRLYVILAGCTCRWL